MRQIYRLLIVLVVVGFSIQIPLAQGDPEHPRIIVRRTEFAGLRQRAAQEPWASMKTEALSKAATLTYNASEPAARVATIQLRDVISYTTLAYILDEDSKQPEYAQKVYNELSAGLTDLATDRAAAPNNTIWDWNVPYANAIFNGIVALDIVYDDLTPAQISQLENLLQQAKTSLVQNVWKLSPIAVNGVWDIYQGNDNVAARRAEYLQQLEKEITPDGIFTSGTGYAIARMTGQDREQKALFMDILEYQGYHDFYTNPRYQKFYLWLFGHALSPNNLALTFGDTGMAGGITARQSPHHQRAARFGSEVLGAAAASTSPYTPVGRLFNYILMDVYPDPSLAAVPSSRVAADGGAWFHDTVRSESGLGGAMWNLISPADDHARKETNAISLSGYGEQLITNAGYVGWGEGALGYTWDYMHARAVSNNIGLIDYDINASGSLYNPSTTNDHVKKEGTGIVESLLTNTLQYARGGSGASLPNGAHWRDFIYVLPKTGVNNGYWLLFDQFDAQNASANVHIVLHPFAAVINTVTEEQEYEAVIREAKTGADSADVRLNIFYVTPPTQITQYTGVIGEFGPKTFEAKYLLATYSSDANGIKNLVTALFPSDATHTKAAMARIIAEGAAGVRIQHQGAVDYAFEGSTTTTETYTDGGLTVDFRATNLFYRQVGAALDSFFIRQGRVFKSGAYGLDSSSDVTAYFNGNRWQVIAAGETTLKLFYPEVQTVTVNGQVGQGTQTGSGEVTLQLPAGNYTIVVGDAPNPESNLLTNPGFETQGSAKNIPANWKLKGSTLNKRVCNKVNRPGKPDKVYSKEGACAYQLTVSGKLSQKFIPQSLLSGTTLNFSGFVQGKGITTAEVIIKAKHADKSSDKTTVGLPAGDYPYQAVSWTLSLTKDAIKVKIQLVYSGIQGKAYMDELSLTAVNSASAPVLSLPSLLELPQPSDQ